MAERAARTTRLPMFQSITADQHQINLEHRRGAFHRQVYGHVGRLQ